MPWLLGTALLHSAIVVEKRNALKVWTILLAILTFSLSLIGTFIVRSGVLTSVHAFATDPERGFFILILLALAIGGSLTLFAIRAPAHIGRASCMDSVCLSVYISAVAVSFTILLFITYSPLSSS